MALNQNYYQLWFESFRLSNTSGHINAIQLKLVAGQNLPQEILKECKSRAVDPFTLLTACNEKLLTNYPVDTKFLLKAKLNDREGGGLFFYNYFGWEPIEVKCTN